MQLIAPLARVISLGSIKQTMGTEPLPPLQHQKAADGIVFIKQNHAFIKLALFDIKHIAAKDNYLDIFTCERNYLVRGTMKETEANLPVQFVRVHRSYIINILHLDSFATDYALVNGCSVPVGPDYYRKLIERVTILGS